jgi:hypothetical protein
VLEYSKRVRRRSGESPGDRVVHALVGDAGALVLAGVSAGVVVPEEGGPAELWGVGRLGACAGSSMSPAADGTPGSIPALDDAEILGAGDSSCCISPAETHPGSNWVAMPPAAYQSACLPTLVRRCQRALKSPSSERSWRVICISPCVSLEGRFAFAPDQQRHARASYTDARCVQIGTTRRTRDPN